MSLRRVTKKAAREGLEGSNLRRVALKVAPDLVDFGIDAAFKAYDHRKMRAPEVEEPQEDRMVYGGEAKSFKEQTDVDYCIECSVKHSQTAKVLMREALQRAEAGDPNQEGVKEKVRGAVEELCGLEDDTTTVSNEMVSALNISARELRKFIYTKGAEMGKASVEDLREIKGMVDKLVEASYTVRAAEECPSCNIESICGGDVDCMTFLIEAAEKSGTDEEWKSFLKEARSRYGDRK